MTITTKDEHVVVTAEEGNYVGLADESVFGESLSLGVNTTSEDCIEKPMNEWPSYVEGDVIKEETTEEELISDIDYE